METREHEFQPQAQASRQGNLSAGLVLIGIGLMVFLVNRLELGQLFIPLLGGSFLLWGILARAAGPLIPGGILSGIGLGIALTSQAGQTMSDDHTGGLFLLGFAAGWFSITLLSLIFTEERLWWPLIPGGIMAVIGGSVLLGGVWLELLSLIMSVAGAVWPLGLIALGVFLLWRQRAAREE